MNKIRAALRRAYLRYRIACAEHDAEVHNYHAAIEPLIAAAARQQAEAWRVELAILTPARCAEH